MTITSTQSRFLAWLATQSGASLSDVAEALASLQTENPTAAAILDAALGGGARTQTATVTANAASGFFVDTIFDLGGPCVAFINTELLSLDADGEVIGLGAGEIGGLNFNALLDFLGASFNGVTWFQTMMTNLDSFEEGTLMRSVGDQITAVVATTRYVKARAGVVYGNQSIYNGVNEPIATFEITVTY